MSAAAVLVLSWMTTEHFPPWVSWHSDVLVFFAVFLLAWVAVIRRFRSNSSRIEIPRLIAPFALIAVIAIFQASTGIITFWGDAIVVLFFQALCAACVLLGFNAKREPPDLLAAAFVLGAFASTIVAFAQMFDLWPNSAWVARMPELRRPGGNLGQPNHLATLIVLGIASVALVHSRGRISSLLSAAVLLVLCTGLAITESRGGALALVVLLVWWQLKRAHIARNVPVWAGPVLGVVFLFMAMAWPALLNVLHLAGSAENRFVQGDVRMVMWPQMLEAILQRPWQGWGILEVPEAHNAVAHVTPSTSLSYSHNLFIDFAVWMGIPIALLLATAMGVWFVRRLVAANGLTSWYCLAVLLALAIHAMLEFPFAYAYFLAPALFLAGVLERSVGVPEVLRARPGPVLAILLVCSSAMIWSVMEYLAIEEDFRIVRFEQLRIGNTAADHHIPQVVMLTQLGALLSGSRIELRPAMPAEDLDRLRSLAMRFPWIATQYRYAFALALNGQQQEAVRQFQVLRMQRGEKIYEKVKTEINEMAKTRYPQLRTLTLP
ncbi:MAG: Wzy polymerase domain-containing protein [Ramlibacter sp.]